MTSMWRKKFCRTLKNIFFSSIKKVFWKKLTQGLKYFYKFFWAIPRENLYAESFFWKWEFFRGVGSRFEKWSTSSHVRTRPNRSRVGGLVRLITLIGLNKLLTNIKSPKSLKKFSHTTFRWSVVRKRSCLVFWKLSWTILLTISFAKRNLSQSHRKMPFVFLYDL